jgi:hypothetical protein
VSKLGRWIGRRAKPIETLREWQRADGETVYAIHPLYAALTQHYAPDLPFDSAMKVVSRRAWEIARGDRRLPEEVAEEIIEIDREHRASGYPDENIAGLVALLQGQHDQEANR